MAAEIQPSLSSDIQRALQHAVGQANIAILQSKTSKRQRVDIDRVDQSTENRSRRRRQSRSGDDGAGGGASASGVVADDVRADGDDELGGESVALRKRSSRRGKKDDKKKAAAIDHRAAPQTVQQVEDTAQQSDSGLVNSQASSAFLSAVVAAASATAGQQEHGQAPYHGPPSSPGIPSPFVPFPPSQYDFSSGYGQPEADAPPSSLFHTPAGFPLSDLAFGSNDDILRALQDLDVSKIADVLKTIGDVAAAANIPLDTSSAFLSNLPLAQTNAPQPSQQQRPPVQPSRQAATQHQSIHLKTDRRVLDLSLPESEQHANPEHAYILANKWMNARKLAEMVKDEGLVYKKGKFSAIEEEQIKASIENFRVHKGLTREQIQEVIFQRDTQGKDNAFWSEITSAVPFRPIIAVYHHVRRTWHPLKQQGKWSAAEDACLKQAVADLGQQWEKVSKRVGRMSSDCRDRHRNHIANREVRVTGQWTKEEEEELTRIVTEMTVQQGKDFDNDVFWGKVSERMMNRRGRQQCRIKWTDSLSKTVKNEGQKPRWSPKDAYILIHKIDSLNVRDDTEIDWKTLPDPDWNLWSAHSLQRRWLTMKRGLRNHEDLTHREIMDILRVKKAQIPPTSLSSTRKRKVTSPADVNDNDINGSIELDPALLD